MSYPLSGGIPQVLTATVSAGTPYVCNFAGRTNYLMVTVSGAGTMAFNNQGNAVKLAVPTGGNTISWQGPVKTSGLILNAQSGNVRAPVRIDLTDP
ncbi:MAG: hypothetical protein EOO40_05840, partial [Deltaproteobacteria bacterium]